MQRTDLDLRAAEHWRRRRGIPSLTFERPDRAERQRKAVDVLGRDSEGHARLVLEHTLVECTPEQRTRRIAVVQMFAPLEQELAGVLPLPGNYVLNIEPREVMGLKREERRIRDWVREWAIQIAPSLALGSPTTAPAHFRTETVPGTPLQVTLARWPGRDGRFVLRFPAPESLDPLRQSIARALTAKCPKLREAKETNPAADSLLLLEIHDVPLGNLDDLNRALLAEAPVMGVNEPDHIWLVDSTDEPATILIAKEGGVLGHVAGEAYHPYALGSRASTRTP